MAHGGDIYSHPHVSLDFSVNTNPLGMPEAIRRALMTDIDSYSRYPDPQCRALRAAIARHERVSVDSVLCGNGAADLIYRLCSTLKPRKALVLAPTFTDYAHALQQSGCKVIHHSLSAEAQFELQADIAERLVPGVDIIFLCQPNNPTGRLIAPQLLYHLLCIAHQNHTRVVVDECFLDFTYGPSSKIFLPGMPGLIVLKAFTKMYAMAGLRLGYMLSEDRALLDRLNASAQSWSVSVPAQTAGIAALSCTYWPEITRHFLVKERKTLHTALASLGLTVFSSDANFLLIRSDTMLYEPLLNRGILIRSCEDFKGLDGSYFRIGLKKQQDNACLIQAIKEVLHG